MRSRLLSSRSMAARMKSARASSSSKTSSIRASVPAGNLAGMASWLICFRPIKKIINVISPIDKPYLGDII